MSKLKFITPFEGFKLLKDYYLTTSKVVVNELCDSILEDRDTQIDSSVHDMILFLAVQLLRSWDHEEEVHGFELVRDEKKSRDRVYRKNTYLYKGFEIPLGTRIGLNAICPKSAHYEDFLDYGVELAS